MYSGNREYYALKRQLIDETKQKLSLLPLECDEIDDNNIGPSNVTLLNYSSGKSSSMPLMHSKMTTTPQPSSLTTVDRLMPPYQFQSLNSQYKRRKLQNCEQSMQQQDQTKRQSIHPLIQLSNPRPLFSLSSMSSSENCKNNTIEKKQRRGITYVYEWFDDGELIYGYGCNTLGDACRLKLNITPGLFVVSSNVPVLREICALHGYGIEVYDKITYKSNSFAVWDIFYNYNVVKDCVLVKIITKRVDLALKLYSLFKYNSNSYKFVGIPQYYDVTKIIIFELLINDVKQQKPYAVPQTVMRWFDKDLKSYDDIKPITLPIITFDIETVSDDPHRVPTGDAINDILYSVSIHHTHTNVLYSLIYLPLHKRQDRRKLNDLVIHDGYDVVPDKNVDDSKCINVLECYDTEYDLLVRTMQLLTLNKKLHFLLGYNSISYDIKFLLVRCVYYNISISKFIWREGYSFGVEQMHLDLFRIIVMRYRFKSYTLNDVSREIMKDSKTGVSAVALRFSFFKMLETQKFLKHIDSNEQLPSIRDTLHYNNADTLLVSKLESRTKSIEFIIQRAMACQVPVSTMTTNYNKMQYKLWNECFVVGLKLKIFLTTFKSHIANVIIPMPSVYSPVDLIDVTFDLSEKLNVNERTVLTNIQNNAQSTRTITAATTTITPPTPTTTATILSSTNELLNSNGNNNNTSSTVNLLTTTAPDMTEMVSNQQRNSLYTRYATTDKKAKFPGGANFCLGEINADNVQMYDYVTAYPLLMDRKNISDETLAIFPARILLSIYSRMVRHEEFKTYDYLAHSGQTKPETIILYYQYIYNGLYCGGEFPFTQEELYRRQESPVIIIWEGRRGVLSEIVANFNVTRARTKIMRKTLDEAYTLVEEKIRQLVELKQLMEEDDDDDDNNDSNNEEGSDNDDDNGNNTNNELNLNANTINATNNNDVNCNFGFDFDDDDNNNDVFVGNDVNATTFETNSKKIDNTNTDFGFDDSDIDDYTDNNSDKSKNLSNGTINDTNDIAFGFEDDDSNDISTNVNNCIEKSNECTEETLISFGFEDGGNDDDDDDDDVCANDNHINGINAKNTQIVTNNLEYDDETIEEPSNILNDNNPFGFEFVNKYITVYENQMCIINDEELRKCDEPIEILTNILKNISLESNKTSNSYELQKSIVSSIYGCVGKMIPVVAAGITCMTRNALLASAQYCQSLGHEILYIDTDSIMITGCNEDLSAELNRRFPHMEMEMKVARKCMFVKRKTYYKLEDGVLKYGQNVNGPTAWRQCVEYFNKQTHLTTNDDIYESFYNFYMEIYQKLLSYKKICPEFLALFTQTIKTKDTYKTMTVAAKFKEYLAQHYEAIAGANKHKIFYYLDNTVMMPCLRPELDIKSVNDLRKVNLFKYYQNMFTTIFNLIKFHVRKNNEPYKITISSKYVLLMMLKGFLDAYERVFDCNINNINNIEITPSTDCDDIFTEDIYEAILVGDEFTIDNDCEN